MSVYGKYKEAILSVEMVMKFVYLDIKSDVVSSLESVQQIFSTIWLLK